MQEKEILKLAGKLMLAKAMNDAEEIKKVSSELAELARQSDDEHDDDVSQAQGKGKRHFLLFTKKELLKMPKNFRHTFRAEGMTICYRVRKRGRNSHDYEARYRRHGYNISVSALTLEDLKKRFIEVLHNAENEKEKTKIPKNFNEFAMFYFENFRKRKVTERTYQTDIRRYKKNILPVLGNIPINKITPSDCQEVLDCQLKKGFERNAQDIYSLLNVIFKMAIAHGLIDRNPLAVIQPITHEREHGKALSKKEEKILLQATKDTPYQLMFAIALYTGLRPNEYKTAKIENGFIVAVNSKRKNGKIEYKKIPITPMLEPYIKGVEDIKFYVPDVMRKKFNEIFPDHKLYDLRTTFYTRCQECGIADVARNVFVGHSLGKLGNTYTDLSDEFLIKEGKKFKY